MVAASPLTRGALSEPVRAVGGEVWVDGGHNPHAAAALRLLIFTGARLDGDLHAPVVSFDDPLSTVVVTSTGVAPVMLTRSE